MLNWGYVRLFLGLLTASVVWGQTSKGTIAGTILDSSGAAVPSAQVTAKDTQGAESRTVTSGLGGEYRIDAITPSIYTITASAPGFNQKEVGNINVQSSVTTSQNITLEVGAVGQTVAVEASGAQIQTESGELSSTISAQEIAKLPINSLNPIDLVLTQPGVVAVASRDTFTNGSGFSANGLRPRANNFLIDGFDNNDQSISGQALQPQNVEAIKGGFGAYETPMHRNSVAAELLSLTLFIRTVPTSYHGSAWERYTGSGINALTSEEKRSGITSVPRLTSITLSDSPLEGRSSAISSSYLAAASGIVLYGAETGESAHHSYGSGRGKFKRHRQRKPKRDHPGQLAGRSCREHRNGQYQRWESTWAAVARV